MDDQHQSGTEHTEGFGWLLQRYRERAGLGCGELARAAKVHPSYLSRLERGERTPTQPVVESLIRALELDPLAADGLRVSVGYAPVIVAQLGTWPMALQTVAAVLVAAESSSTVLAAGAREGATNTAAGGVSEALPAGGLAEPSSQPAAC